ncbi:MAG: hypothetical protein LUE17_03005 [Planctomycetaceae bacterium]|nr:hypothetical protein [Planctomycetaceae bacterium]
MHHDNSLLFGRYSREECGLPPPGADFVRERLPWRKTLGLLVVTALLAWLGGSAMSRYRQSWLAVLPSRVVAAPGSAEALLTRGRSYATALANDPLARRNLAYAVTVAAERSRYRLGYYANAETLFRGIDRDALASPLDRFATDYAASAVYAELGDNTRALEALKRAAVSLSGLPQAEQQSYQLLYVNSLAYLLATIPEAEGGNPGEALHLARLMITSRDPLPDGSYASDSAAFLDTLAAAYHADGRSGDALATQTMALGLADSQGLDIYLNHYDLFSRSIRPE